MRGEMKTEQKDANADGEIAIEWKIKRESNYGKNLISVWMEALKKKSREKLQ